jgi:predicted AAA+ superfamily ATPase
MYLHRQIITSINEGLANNPVVAILGPRQCGKSTFVKHILQNKTESVYLDLERPSDLAKLNDPEWFLASQRGRIICIDEIQRKPELFPLIRSLVDEWNSNGNFLILGSASVELIKQGSESLAGRIAFKRLTPFLLSEVPENTPLEQYLENGGFPRSYLAPSNRSSFDWRENFISTFLERDLLQWSGFSVGVMRRLWVMLAYNNGQLLNYSSLGNSLGISGSTVRNYIDLLEGTFMVEVLPPYFSNYGKRLVKSPKVYIADTGIAAALLGLTNFNQITSHPVFGSLWETLVIANLRGHFSTAKLSFYRTSNGAECDIVMEYRGKVFAIECKASKAPILTKGNFLAFDDINPYKKYVVSPIKEGWSMKDGVLVVSISELISNLYSCTQ